jgi:type IV pilus assembly protein PilA
MSTTTAILGAVALSAIGTTAYQWSHAFRAESELAALTVDRDSLRAQLRTEQQHDAQNVATLKDELDALKAKSAALAASAVAPRAARSTALQIPNRVVAVSQQKAMLNNLRQLAAARDQFELENGRPPASLDELVGETKYVRRLNTVDGESYDGIGLAHGQPMTLTTANGVTVTYDPVGGATTNIPNPSPNEVVAEVTAQLGPQVGASFQRAMQAYRAANGDALPQNPQALLAYFPTPQEGADFLEAIQAMGKNSGK